MPPKFFPVPFSHTLREYSPTGVVSTCWRLSIYTVCNWDYLLSFRPACPTDFLPFLCPSGISNWIGPQLNSALPSSNLFLQMQPAFLPVIPVQGTPPKPILLSRSETHVCLFLLQLQQLKLSQSYLQPKWPSNPVSSLHPCSLTTLSCLNDYMIHLIGFPLCILPTSHPFST